MLVQDLLDEVVRRHVLPVDDHVIYQVELQKRDQLPVQRV